MRPSRPAHSRRERIGFSSQSGALGLAVLEHARRQGLGLSGFVSVGNKADVSSNDLLEWWDDDPDTNVVMLYMESFGNPRKFARLARRVSRHKPVIALKAGATRAGARAAGSHTAALAGSDTAVDALFHQAGVIRVRTLEELIDLAGLLSRQPLPAGPRVAVLTNAGGLGILCADACEASGLTLPTLTAASRRQAARAAAGRGKRHKPRRHAWLGDRRQLPAGSAVAACRPERGCRDRALRAARDRRPGGRRRGDRRGDPNSRRRQAGARGRDGSLASLRPPRARDVRLPRVSGRCPGQSRAVRPITRRTRDATRRTTAGRHRGRRADRRLGTR